MLKTANLRIALGFWLTLAPSAAWAIPETDYAAAYAARVAPFFASGQDGSFDGVERATLRYRKFEVPADREDAAIVIVNGRAESFLKYGELTYDLHVATGGRASIYLYDHRGQGQSSRMVRNPQKGYVGYFDDYVDDLDIFVNQVVRARPHRRLLLIGHSMGGAVAALYLERNPAVFASAVLATPMLAPVTGKYSLPMAYAIATAATLTGQGRTWAPGEGGFDPAKAVFAANVLTTSEPRFESWLGFARERPDTIVGGATYRWVMQAISGSWEAGMAARLIQARVLLLQAGRDALVKPAAQDRFCARIGRRCVKRVFAEAKHDILRERDVIRDAALAEIAKFFRF